jgi:hypothetical protein
LPVASAQLPVITIWEGHGFSRAVEDHFSFYGTTEVVPFPIRFADQEFSAKYVNSNYGEQT